MSTEQPARHSSEKVHPGRAASDSPAHREPGQSKAEGVADANPVRLRAHGLGVTYGSVKALADVHFEIRRGEVMALMGENGAGKSSFVKVLAGLVQPSSGTLEMDGQELHLTSSRRSQAAGIAVVQQELSSVPSMSIAENLLLGSADAPALWTHKALERTRPLLAQVGLEHLDPRRHVDELSVAEVQLLEVAKVLSRDAKLVVFDEPTAALSDVEIERVMTVIRGLAQSGRSIIYVTHRIPEVFALTDKVTVFRNGTSLPAKSTETLDADSLVRDMLGRSLGTMYPDRPLVDGPEALEVNALTSDRLTVPVDLRVRAGEIFGLVGQVGSGAAELVQTLAGVATGAEGEVRLEGRPLSLRSRHAGIVTGVAYCSSDRKRDGLFALKSAERNLSSAWLDRVSRFGLVSRRAERALAVQTSEKFGFDASRLRTPAGSLSGGNQQKLALGKWLGREPRVLLVEEPTRGVDVGARAEIYKNLRQLCEEGMCIVVSSSDTSEILHLADTIATFYRGRMTAVAPHAEWTEERLAREAMHEREQSYEETA